MLSFIWVNCDNILSLFFFFIALQDWSKIY